jgi:hypothetical protein
VAFAESGTAVTSPRPHWPVATRLYGHAVQVQRLPVAVGLVLGWPPLVQAQPPGGFLPATLHTLE